MLPRLRLALLTCLMAVGLACPSTAGAATAPRVEWAAATFEDSPAEVNVRGKVAARRAGLRVVVQHRQSERWARIGGGGVSGDGTFAVALRSPRLSSATRLRVVVFRGQRRLCRSRIIKPVPVSSSPSAPPPSAAPGGTPLSDSPTTLGSSLSAGQSLRPGQQLRSPGGAFTLLMRRDGNLTLADAKSSVVWRVATNTPGAQLEMQGDGNLVLYASGRSAWSSSTDRHPGASLALTDAGGLELSVGRPIWTLAEGYLGDTLRAGWWLRPGQQLWSKNRRFQLVMQGDGNLVVYESGQARWSTGTVGVPGAEAVMQGDGNLVVYQGPARWSSGSHGRGGDRVVMQDDGNLVIYAGGTAVWSRSTGLIAGSTPQALQAAAWAAAQVGQTRAPSDVAGWFADWAPGPYGEWSGDCAKFVTAAWRKAGVQIARGNAVDQYLAYRGRIQGGTPPRGALVFWPNVTQWGHIAIADGSGGVYTTRGLDGNNLPIAQVPAGTFGAPAGWVLP